MERHRERFSVCEFTVRVKEVTYERVQSLESTTVLSFFLPTIRTRSHVVVAVRRTAAALVTRSASGGRVAIARRTVLPTRGRTAVVARWRTTVVTRRRTSHAVSLRSATAISVSSRVTPVVPSAPVVHSWLSAVVHGIAVTSIPASAASFWALGLDVSPLIAKEAPTLTPLCVSRVTAIAIVPAVSSIPWW
jgi:hypothetical protein